MNPGQRCDEIIRLIDEALGVPAAPVPTSASPTPARTGRTAELHAAPAGRRPRRAA